MPFRGGTASFTAPRVDKAKAEKEKKSLTKEEKDAAYRDLYGLESPSEEVPAVIDAQLLELDEALGAIKNNTYWNNAQELCPDIANDRDFRLRFLRSDDYDAKKAAQRMLNYWKLKHQLFGQEKAYKKLSLSDLNDKDLATPRNRGLWVLPKPDRAGRRIILTRKPKWAYEHRDNFLRWVWYIADTVASPDPASQLNGLLVIGFDDGPFSFQQFDRKLESKVMHMGLECMPVRWIAVHVFYDSKVHEMLIPFIRFMFGKKLRARFLIYPGSKRHNRLERMEQVGMPREMLPKVMGGDDDFDIAAWVEEELEREKNEMKEEKQEAPASP